MSYGLATSRIPIPSELHKSYQFPYPGMPSLAQGEAIFFPFFCQINSHVALSGVTSIVPLWDSTHSLVSLIQITSFNASAFPKPDAQVCQTLKTHLTHCDDNFIQSPGSAREPSRSPSASLDSSYRYPYVIGRSGWPDHSNYFIQVDFIVPLNLF